MSLKSTREEENNEGDFDENADLLATFERGTNRHKSGRMGVLVSAIS